MNNRPYFDLLFPVVSTDPSFALAHAKDQIVEVSKLKIAALKRQQLQLAALEAQLTTELDVLEAQLGHDFMPAQFDAVLAQHPQDEILRQREAELTRLFQALHAEIQALISSQAQRDAAFSAALTLNQQQQGAKIALGYHLRQGLASTLKDVVKQAHQYAISSKNPKFKPIANDYLKAESVIRFNNDFKGYVEINKSGELLFTGASHASNFCFETTFLSLDFKDIAVHVQKLLNATYSLLGADNFKFLHGSLLNLSIRHHFKLKIKQATSPAFEMTHSLRWHFIWNDAVHYLDQVKHAVSKTVEEQASIHASNTAIEKAQQKLEHLKAKLAGFKSLNLTYQQELITNRAINNFKAAHLEELSQLNEDFVAKISPPNQAFGYRDQAVVTANYLKQIELSLLNLPSIDPLNQDEKKVQVQRMNLHVRAAMLTRELFNIFKDIHLSYEAFGEAQVPQHLTDALNRAFEKRRLLVEALGSDLPAKIDQAISLSLEFDDTLADLAVAGRQTTQLCGLLIQTIRNRAYWHQQLPLSFLSIGGLGGEGGSQEKLKTPTCHKTEQDILNKYDREQDLGWEHDLVKAKAFMAELKVEARKRKAHKVCGFFNPGRTANTSAYLNFISELNVDKIDNDTLLLASKLDAVQKAVKANATPQPESLRF